MARRNLVASSAGVPLYCSSDCEQAGPVCDFCVHYRFNGDAAGWYTGEGVCAHPEHPGPMDPTSGCPDYHCAERSDVNPQSLTEHEAAPRRREVAHIAE